MLLLRLLFQARTHYIQLIGTLLLLYVSVCVRDFFFVFSLFGFLYVFNSFEQHSTNDSYAFFYSFVINLFYCVLSFVLLDCLLSVLEKERESMTESLSLALALQSKFLSRLLTSTICFLFSSSSRFECVRECE